MNKDLWSMYRHRLHSHTCHQLICLFHCVGFLVFCHTYIHMLCTYVYVSHFQMFWTLFNDNIVLVTYTWTNTCQIQPIADRVAQHLEIISKTFATKFCPWDLRLVPSNKSWIQWESGTPGTKLKVFRNLLQMLCHPICNWLYLSSIRVGVGQIDFDCQ